MREECRYKDQNQNIEIRVEDLLSRMTLEEKAAQLCGNLPSSVITDGELDMEKLREVGKHGHGRFTQYSLVGLVSPEKIASISNRIQQKKRDWEFQLHYKVKTCVAIRQQEELFSRQCVILVAPGNRSFWKQWER